MLKLFAALLASATTYQYTTSFNSKAWGNFQEHVSSCYLEDAGSVFLDGGAMFVASNSAGSVYSNHLIAQRRLKYTGLAGVATYTLDFYVSVNPSDWLTYPEDGPEFSVQNTRFVGGQYQTATAGFQYAGNPWGTPHWNFWHQTSPLAGTWVATTGPTLTFNQWYTATVVADYDSNTYVSATVCLQDGGSCAALGVDGGALGVNVKWGEEGLWVTAESENIWQGACGGPGAVVTRTTVVYDGVTYRQQ